MTEIKQNDDFFSELGREVAELPRTLGDGFRRSMIGWRNSMRQMRAARLDYVVFPLHGPLPERDGPPRNFIQRQLPLPPEPLTVAALNRRLRHIGAATNVHGVIFVLNGLAAGGLANLQNLRRSIERLQAAGKEVVVFTKFMNLPHYYVASAADRVVVPPSASFEVVGLTSNVVFLKDALARIGLEGEAAQISPFKTAPDQFVRSDMSSEMREMLSWLLDDNFEMICEGIAKGRDLPVDRVKQLINEAPFSAERARQVSLVDDIAYEDELGQILASPPQEPIAAGTVEPALGDTDEAGIVTVISGSAGQPPTQPETPAVAEDKPDHDPVKLYSWQDAVPLIEEKARKRSRRYIGVISANGAIMDGVSRNPPVDIPIPILGGPSVGDLTVVQLLRRAEEDDKMAGLILHVDSPGGSALASDLMWREIRRVAQKKPVLAYMGSVAASGGYYLSAGCDHIMAQRGTVTGSIGVLTAKFTNKKLLAMVSANRESIQRGQHAAIYKSNDKWSLSERERVTQSIKDIYHRFKSIVCETRPIAYEALDEVALGRVWTGRQARGHGLVDSFGDFEDAVAKMIEMAELPAGDNHLVPVVDLYPKNEDPRLPQPFEVPEEMLKLFLGDWQDRLSRPQCLLPFSIRFW